MHERAADDATSPPAAVPSDAMPADGTASGEPPERSTRRRLRRAAWIAVASLVVVLVALVGAFGVDAFRLRDASTSLMTAAPAAQADLSSGDSDELSEAVEALVASADEFAAATEGPHWRLASHLPWVGDQVRPLMAAGAAVDAVASDALVPLVSVGGLSVLEDPPVVDGRLDPGMLDDFVVPLAGASATLAEQQDALAEVDLTGTVDAVSSRFVELQGQLGELSEMVDGASVVSQLLPTMLGGDGPRTYAVILQNNAEPRAAGGIPGAVILMNVDDGAPSMGAYFSAADLLNGHPIDVATEEELAMFGYEIDVYPHDATFTPEFPRTAQLISAYIERRTGVAPDGVISLDPVALGYMLGGAPPRDVAGIAVDGANLAQVMLSGAYAEFEGAKEQDAFFAQAAGVLFQDILAGGSSTVQGLRRALEEGRFAVWSADDAEQSLLADTPAGGDLLRDDVWAGVFLNDASGTKMGYYVDTSVVAGSCELAVTVTHTFDGDLATLPDYVAEGVGLVPRGVFAASLLVFPPTGADVTGVEVDGEKTLFGAGVLAGRQSIELGVRLEPGQSTTVTLALAGASEPVDSGAIAITPGARTPTIELESEGC